MEWTEIFAFMDEGLSKVLAFVVIYAVVEVVRKGPAYFSRLIIATENSTAAITINSTLVKDTKNMHEAMDIKIEDIKQDVEMIKTELKKSGLKDAEIIRVLNSLESKIERLGKSQDAERM